MVISVKNTAQQPASILVLSLILTSSCDEKTSRLIFHLRRLLCREVVQVALQIPRPTSSILHQESVRTNRQARTRVVDNVDPDDGDNSSDDGDKDDDGYVDDDKDGYVDDGDSHLGDNDDCDYGDDDGDYNGDGVEMLMMIGHLIQA